MPRRVLEATALIMAGAVFTFALSVVMPIVALLLAFAAVSVLILRTAKDAPRRPSEAVLTWTVVGMLAAEAIYLGLAVVARA